jgi:hypothetical protein
MTSDGGRNWSASNQSPGRSQRRGTCGHGGVWYGCGIAPDDRLHSATDSSARPGHDWGRSHRGPGIRLQSERSLPGDGSLLFPFFMYNKTLLVHVVNGFRSQCVALTVYKKDSAMALQRVLLQRFLWTGNKRFHAIEWILPEKSIAFSWFNFVPFVPTYGVSNFKFFTI